jgi:hypothetical protein
MLDPGKNRAIPAPVFVKDLNEKETSSRNTGSGITAIRTLFFKIEKVYVKRAKIRNKDLVDEDPSTTLKFLLANNTNV